MAPKKKEEVIEAVATETSTCLTHKDMSTITKVKVKKMHPDAVVPSYASNGDAGCDLTAVSVIHTDMYSEYDTGLAFEIPEGYVGLLFPRSSISKTSLTLSNSVGVIDSSYRGKVTMRFKATADNYSKSYEVGDRIGQIIIIPYPTISFIESEDLSETKRGAGSYGSTGA